MRRKFDERHCPTARARSDGRSALRASLAATTAIAALLAASRAFAGPTGGTVVDGSAAITQSGSATNINQSTHSAIINWQGFSIGAGESVNFLQPTNLSVTLNRVIGNEQSVIAGALNANGRVFLVNSNGVLFTRDAQVNVGGLVASTLDISNADFKAGNYRFSGSSSASVVNRGNIAAADGGYIALLGKTVSNEGAISARLGTVALASGEAITLNFGGDSLVDVTIDKGTLNALVENKGAIKADGGQVVLTARAADAVLSAQVNNSGIIQARSIADLTGGGSKGTVKIGKIKLLAQGGTTKVAGTLDASAPEGGKGGTIETSGENVNVADGAMVTTASASGENGSWLIDPTNFTIVSGSAAQTASGIGAATLLASLANGNVTIATAAGGSDAGDINVNAALSWAANTLTLNAAHDINVNAPLTWSGSSGLALNAGWNGGSGGGVGSIYVNAVMTANDTASFTATYGKGVMVTGTIPTGATTESPYSYTIPDGIYFGYGYGSDGKPNGTFAGKLDFKSAGTVSLGGKAYTVISTWDRLAALSGTASGNYVLAGDLTAPTTAYSTSVIGTLSGNLNGFGHTITGLTIYAPGGNIGLIRWISGGAVTNLGLVNVSISNPSSFVGALAGQIRGGTVGNVFATGSVGETDVAAVGGLIGQAFISAGTASAGTIFNSWTNVAVRGGSTVGGFIGGNLGATIVNSTSYGDVTAASNGVHPSQIGGFVGVNSGLIVDSNAYGSVTATNGEKIGGFAGTNSNTFPRGSTTPYANRYGRIVNSHAYGNLDMKYNKGREGGGLNMNVGGFIGLNDTGAIITNSSEYGNITVDITADPGSSLFGVGGFFGQNAGVISYSTVYGNIYLKGLTQYLYSVGAFGGTNGSYWQAGTVISPSVICLGSCANVPLPMTGFTLNSGSKVTGATYRDVPAERAAERAAADRVATASGRGDVLSGQAGEISRRRPSTGSAAAGRRELAALSSPGVDEAISGVPSALTPPPDAQELRRAARRASAATGLGRAAPARHRGAGYGAKIQDIEADGKRFDLDGGGKPAPGAKAQ